MEDRTPFEAITFQFGISKSEVIGIMRTELKRSSFNLWRKRVNSGISQKHLKKRNPEIERFKCTRQRTISLNKISKERGGFERLKNIVIIGCGSGIGLATAKQLQNEAQIIGISRTETSELNNVKLHFYQKDILTDSLDDVSFPEKIDGLVYAPGSINLKPFGRLSDEDFKKDFEINVLGAIKIIQKLLPNLKKSESASVVLFSTVAGEN